ncbi:hypothetical protein C8P66_10749 [Humitalea rosea]|uniref:Uncharacterized protein n=1 Tax=Humitalea rosea TaxID=990373 RepID=A0A2W7ILN0_9PROT|nr:hypothetical protein [Humitalea rosea]PZW47011.1 hypothetical protein C8P66_10749 [Humitalea rosea]
MEIMLRPALGPIGAMPGAESDDLLDRAWRDPWTRADCRRVALGMMPGCGFVDDATLLDCLKFEVRRGRLTVSAASASSTQFAPPQPPSKPRQSVLLIDAFEKGKGGGAFINITRAEVVAGLRERVKKPEGIDQGSTSLCGPSSLCYNLLLDDPDTYVRYVIDLYETGAAMLGKTKVKPGESCRSFKPKGIAPVDWIATASLRDSENLMFNYDDPSDAFGGITLPNNLAGWMEGLGYTSVTNETNVWFSKDPEDFDQAVRLLRQGQRVCIFVNSRIVDGQEKVSHFYSVPDHWIVLHASGGLAHGTLAATFWTWAQMIPVPKTGAMNADTFCGNFFGYVAGSPP